MKKPGISMIIKFGSIEKSYKAAIQYRNEFLAVASEPGLLNDSRSENNNLSLNLSLSPRNTSDIVGVSRSSREREGRSKREES